MCENSEGEKINLGDKTTLLVKNSLTKVKKGAVLFESRKVKEERRKSGARQEGRDSREKSPSKEVNAHSEYSHVLLSNDNNF